MAAESYPTLAAREAAAAPIMGGLLLEVQLQCVAKPRDAKAWKVILDKDIIAAPSFLMRSKGSVNAEL